MARHRFLRRRCHGLRIGLSLTLPLRNGPRGREKPVHRIVGGSLPAPDGAEQRIFEKHLLPWIGRLFADLEHANAASFYRSVGTLGRVFMDIEKEAFALPS